MDSSRCVVIEIEPPAEEQLLKYLSERKRNYNWVMKENDEARPKVLVCVWWKKEEYKEFSATPLRSFLKRIKNKFVFPPKISKRVTTAVGVRAVCDNVHGSISKYHLEGELLGRLGDLLLKKAAGDTESITDSVDSNTSIIMTKLNILLGIADVVAQHVTSLSGDARVPEVDENTSSSLITHADEYEPARSFPACWCDAVRALPQFEERPLLQSEQDTEQGCQIHE